MKKRTHHVLAIKEIISISVFSIILNSVSSSYGQQIIIFWNLRLLGMGLYLNNKRVYDRVSILFISRRPRGRG
jgi:hypothetical protein